MDSLARDYLAVAFGIDRLWPGFIDAFTGPEELRASLTSAEPATAEGLLEQARVLAEQIAQYQDDVARQGYLGSQVGAMVAVCEQLATGALSYRDEVRRFFAVPARRVPESVFEEAIGDLDELLPGRGDLQVRMRTWRDQFAITPETTQALLEVIVPEIRRRTSAFVDLPSNEGVDFRFVHDKPWSGYNWYLGQGRSRVELNTDLPLRANTLISLVCHEAYPGHHTEHSLRERLLVGERGFGEYMVQLIHTPQALISEGIATLAERMIFDGNELAVRYRETLFPLAGISADPELTVRIEATSRALRAVGANAALGLHAEGVSEAETISYLMEYGLAPEEEARHRMRFLTDPMWRAYIVCYHAGRDLLGTWIDQAPEAERLERFRQLLVEPVYPALIDQWLSGSETTTLSAEAPRS